MQVWQEGTEVALTLAEQLGRGGEALIFAIQEDPYTVAKVYHRPTAARAAKLAAMLAAPPLDPMAKAGHTSITWPTARLVNGEGQFVGYVMPRIDRARLIVEYYTPRTRLQHCPRFQYAYLLRTARNLATAVGALHERGYVIGDLNESNVLVTPQALVSLVDTDSFQVPAGATVFRCRVGKPEYTPPELQGAHFTEIDRKPEHDAFGLGVLIFQLLMQGVHPFAGVSAVGGDAIPSRIRGGQWPYASGEGPVRPSPHAPPWEVLPPTVQMLIWRCFEVGHAEPSRRPTADEWRKGIAEDEKLIISCERNPQHRYHGSLSKCPWCMLTETQGRDPFPTAAMLKEAQERPAPITQPALELPPEAPAADDARPNNSRKERRPIPVPPLSLRPTAKDLQLAIRDAFILLGVAALIAVVVWVVSNRLRRMSEHVQRIDIERVLDASGHTLRRQHGAEQVVERRGAR
jgi:DNA-binding helix-hairpin-helix protein with protein kinase domain